MPRRRQLKTEQERIGKLNVNATIERNRQSALTLAARTGKKATVGKVTIIPAFDGRAFTMDERKCLMREVGGVHRVH